APTGMGAFSPAVRACESLSGRTKPERPVAAPDGADPNIGGAPTGTLLRFLFGQIERHRGRRQREIASAASEFPKTEPPASGPSGKADFGDDLVRLQRGLERAEEKLRGGDHAGSGTPERPDLRPARNGKARQLRGGVGVRQAAAHSAAIADLIMGNVAHRRDQKRMRAGKPAVFKDVAPAHHGAERDALSIDFRFPQLAKLAQID